MQKLMTFLLLAFSINAFSNAITWLTRLERNAKALDEDVAWAFARADYSNAAVQANSISTRIIVEAKTLIEMTKGENLNRLRQQLASFRSVDDIPNTSRPEDQLLRVLFSFRQELALNPSAHRFNSLATNPRGFSTYSEDEFVYFIFSALRNSNRSTPTNVALGDLMFFENGNLQALMRLGCEVCGNKFFTDAILSRLTFGNTVESLTIPINIEKSIYELKVSRTVGFNYKLEIYGKNEGMMLRYNHIDSESVLGNVVAADLLAILNRFSDDSIRVFTYDEISTTTRTLDFGMGQPQAAEAISSVLLSADEMSALMGAFLRPETLAARAF